MNSIFERHPEQDLLRYLDGELSARQSRRLAGHLEDCGRCRAELEEFQATLADCASFRKTVVAQTPEAPAPWRDLYRDFSRIDESLANNSLLVRLMRPLVHSGVPRWAFLAGLTVLIVLFSLNQLRQAPSVQAATLLKKAVAVSQSQPHPARRIRVRSSRHPEFTRMSGVQAALVQVAQAEAVATLFQKANWDWNDPLSASAFEQWRDRQAQKTDEVMAVNDPAEPSEHLTQIRTTSAGGEVESASITLNTDDYDAVSERLVFRDQEWVELSDIAGTSTESAGGAGVPTVEPPVRAAEPPSRPAAFAPGSSASISDEIQVLSALNGIGADLGDPVDVSLAGGKVKVTGPAEIPAQRQEEIRASVASLPHVEVAFTSLPPSPTPTVVSAPNGSAAGAVNSPMQARLEKQLGGHAGFDRFSTQLLDLDDAAMQRVYALHRLAQKFSPEDEASLGSKDRAVLDELSRKHIAVLAEKLDSMEKILAPALSALGGTAASVPPAAHANWQPAADDVFRSASRMDMLLSRMLGMTPGNASPSELMTALGELDSDLADCRRALK
ncbi:MAG TPA: zf-HC2 domain-containing protein [Bryobacteraceae bacterium]|nr:zf-HC2 domain-containing protein [Bryobacteraceae bacterium]